MADSDFIPLTAEQLRPLFEYDPSTGILVRRYHHTLKRAGTTRPDGSRGVMIWRRQYLEHRLIWLLVTGAWPVGEVDHVNGIPGDNRWDNLRDGSHGLNMQNRRAAQRNNLSTGLLGVTKRKNGTFDARLWSQGRNLQVGNFDDAMVAHQAYLTAKREKHLGCTI